MQSAGRLDNIQLMRAFAAAMVVLLHVQHMAVERSGDFEMFRAIPLGFGVDIFFVISGFIITLTSRELVERRDVGRFAVKRLLRIVPLYWICLSLWVALTVAGGALTGDQAPAGLLTADNLLASYLFIPADTRGYGAAYPFPLLVLGWTLNYEMFFYALFALSLLAGPRRFYPLLSGLFAGLVLVGAALPGVGLPLSFWTQPLILEFLAGVALALAYGRGWRLGGRVQALLIAGGVLIWLFLRESSFGPIPPDAKGSYSWPRLLTGGTGAAMIMAAAGLARVQWRGRIADWGARLGDSSYAVYLTHTITLAVVGAMVDLLGIGWSWPLVALVSLCAIAIGHGFHLLIERPLLVWLNRHLPARPARWQVA